VRSWFDRLTLGKDGARRAAEAEQRLTAAEAEQERLRESADAARRRLFEAVKAATEELQQVAADVAPSTPLAAAVQELVGEEGLEDDDDHSEGIDRRKAPSR